MKKALYLTLLALLPASLASCSPSTNSNLLTEKQFSYQALTTSFMVNASSSSALGMKKLANEKENEVSTLLDEIDLLLANFDYQYSSNIVESDKEEYQTKEIITYSSAEEENLEVILYYNTKEEIEQDEEEVEQETTRAGLLIKDETTYKFKTKVENEQEENEVETEEKFILYTSEDEKSYIKSTRSEEVEHNEKEVKYSYEIVENNKKVEEFSFKQEVEDNKEKIKFNVNGKEYKIHTYVEQENTYLKVKNEQTNEITTYLKVVDELGNVTYSIVE
ncbi:MAG: hypothetical protein SPK28_03250 [Bacilli bacterium]|nr:hypothetical protein [Bacilli bacterium]